MAAFAGPLHGEGFRDWAPTPPMGWNSWDCYGAMVDEAAVKANADWMSAHLLEYGWEYCVVDIRWTVQNEQDEFNVTNAVYTLDEYGRYLPDPIRFPSSAGGAGFRPLADYVHAKGLKFGIHIMRGVPKEAVRRKCPVKGADGVTCDRISNGRAECYWLKDNETVVAGRPGAQEYYDSIVELYASWGVDFIKCDDLSAPIYRAREIEMLRRAIDRCGRPIVLSTSPGETPIYRAKHVAEHANMWRMVNDVWDKWSSISHLMPVLAGWLETAPPPGSWPDCDMIPLGTLRLRWYDDKETRCRLTPVERRTLMTLFAIARSPLMFGGNLPDLDRDPETLALLTNRAVLEMHRTGRNPRAPMCTGEFAAFTLDGEGGSRYLALFNLRKEEFELFVPPEVAPKAGDALVDLWSGKALDRLPATLPSHASVLVKIN